MIPKLSERPSWTVSPQGVQARLAVLRSEFEANPHASARAALLYEIGAISEHRLHDEGKAIEAYLNAYNAHRAFRPPLFELVRIFERRRSVANLQRLYEAELRAARGESDRVDALVALGNFLADFKHRPPEGLRLLKEATSTGAGSPAAWLMLERAARRAGDSTLVTRTVEARAEALTSPLMRGLLLIEAATDRAQQGQIDRAFELLRSADEQGAVRDRALAQLARLARGHKRQDELLFALRRHAEVATENRQPEFAAALLHEFARLCGNDVERAESLAAGLDLLPNHPLLRFERMLACEGAGEFRAAIAEAQRLRDDGFGGAVGAVTLNYRLAEFAKADGNLDLALQVLADATGKGPPSAATPLLLDELWREAGRHEERVQLLEERAGSASPDGRARYLWQAAHLVMEEMGDFSRARGLYEGAARLASDRAPILRELSGAALLFGSPEAVRDSLSALLECELDPEEHAAVLRDLYLILIQDLQAEDDAALLQARALTLETAVPWAADSARIRAAQRGDHELLAGVHELLAERSHDDATTAAHLCAAGRAWWRAGDAERAGHTLRSALQIAPTHRYALTLLEEILRVQGETGEVVEVLREAATAQASVQDVENSLLLAAASAEAVGDYKLALSTYEEALDKNPSSTSALWLMRRIAERLQDPDLEIRALETLSRRELDKGKSLIHTLELGELLDRAGRPELAERPLTAALRSEDTRLMGAATLALSSRRMLSAEAQYEALESLAAYSNRDDEDLWLGERFWTAVHAMEDAALAQRTAAQWIARRPKDSAAGYAAWRSHTLGAIDETSENRPAEDGRLEAWLQLGRLDADPQCRGEFLLQALRVSMLSTDGRQAEDAFLIADEISQLEEGSVVAGTALDETMGPSDDPDVWASAIEARVRYAGRESRAQLEAAHARALTTAGRMAEALPKLRAAVEADPDDMPAWDCLRVAARAQGAWEDVVAACDRLAACASPHFRAELLEEAAMVCMDALDDNGRAEARLQAAMETDPSRAIAYGRLHDLLMETEHRTGELVDLICRRIAAIDDPDELSALYYEQARLHRSAGRLDDAETSLRHLLTLEEDHPAGLALIAEVYVSLGRWPQAVEALRRLACADVPATQKRLAHLGAADYLDKKLDDLDGALEELRAVEALGNPDGYLYARIGGIAERAGHVDDAIRAFERAASLASEAEGGARFHRELARLRLTQGDLVGGQRAYKQALVLQPHDAEAIEPLLELLPDPSERKQIIDSYEWAVRKLLKADPVDERALRELRKVGMWRRNPALEAVVLSALVALRVATLEEQEALISLRTGAASLPQGRLSEDAMNRLRCSMEGHAAEVAAMIVEHVAEVENLVPGTYGVGKDSLVRPKDSHEVRDEIGKLAGAFGLAVADFYQGGPDTELIAALPSKRGRASWIVGSDVKAPLASEQRFLVGQLAMAAQEQTLPLVHRSAEDSARFIWAAVAACGVPVRDSRVRGMGATVAAFDKVLPRRVRRAIANSVSLFGGRQDLFLEWSKTAQHTVLRAGLLLSGDLSVPLEAVLRGRGTVEAARQSEEARDLIEFGTSRTFLELRRDLGLAT